ncbi:hypothetical protein OIU84_021144 [Salix udensis]|uniref:Protein kinase domain-containing protein n=1 Tax=Salix udensis TaxID=889485 RepID=A0AAD6KTZ5_9ROSI|nr:hypothetical protein OIU84_021144 [Salix udensis]
MGLSVDCGDNGIVLESIKQNPTGKLVLATISSGFIPLIQWRQAKRNVLFCCVASFICLWTTAYGELTAAGVNYEVEALMGIKNSLVDPHNVLNWDEHAVDPCSWAMVTCSTDNFVTSLGAPSQRLSGTLSPSIGNLTNLQSLLLQDNDISGHIPSELGRLPKLKTIDLSSNNFSGQIPGALSNLNSLQYLRLNNNSLDGAIPASFVNMTQLNFLDLSYNDLSAPVPPVHAKTFNIVGNPLICGTEHGCAGTTPVPQSLALNYSQNSQPSGNNKSHKIALAFGSSLGCICLLVLGFGFILWWRQRHNQQIFFDVNAVKRLKDGNAIGGEIQFQTEVEMISLAVHRNLLRLYGFCMTTTERLLVYPYMSNGSVATRLKGDFGLAKLLDHQDSHVTTAVRGTVGHIAPEYLSTGQSSEKTDVFGFGILLLELISGLRALEFGKSTNQKGALLDWVKKIHQEKKLELLVDKDLKNNYDRIELEETVQVALLCTQSLPSHRP